MNPAKQWGDIRLLIDKGRYQSALPMAQQFFGSFPPARHLARLALGAIHCGMQQPNKAIALFEEAAEQGDWYTAVNIKADFQVAFADALAEGRFTALLERWSQMQAADERGYNNDAQIVRPNDRAISACRLFIALHGAGMSAAMFKEHWHTSAFAQDYVTIYPGSKALIAPGEPGWEDPEKAARDINAVLERRDPMGQVKLRDSVIGGFSQGGTLALRYVVDAKISARNCLLLCPGVPDVSDDALNAAKQRGVKIFLVAGGLDERNVAEIREFDDRLQRAGVQSKLEVDRECGHWFPKEWESFARQAIEFFSA